MRQQWERFRRWVREWVLVHQRWREAELQLSGLRALNSAFVKRGLRDDARIERLEKELASVHEALWAEVPGLTPAEIERLAILAEECGEVARSVGKILRFGWESQSPYGGRTNRVALEREIGSVRAIVNLMLDADDLRLSEVQAWQRSKRMGLAKWTLHQECSMPREDQLQMIRAIESDARA